MIDLYPKYAVNTAKKKNNFYKILQEITGVKAIPFSCARAALVAGLKALGLNRMNEILVPPYLGQCVLSSLSRVVFPAMTPSRRTKAILVYHQFGYPQNLGAIEKIARKKGWVIVNDCANTIFSKTGHKFLISWGDFSVISLSKVYPCKLAGGFVSRQAKLFNCVLNEHQKLSKEQSQIVDKALNTLIKVEKGIFKDNAIFEVHSVYGYLPEVMAVSRKSLLSLPATIKAINDDIDHRKKILALVSGILPGRSPAGSDDEIIPFAVPVIGIRGSLEKISQKIKKELGVEAPVLHFDFARNMLDPDYRKCLAIGCHKGWTEEIVEKICGIIRRYDK